MPDDLTNWPRLYATAVLLGAGFGLLLSLAAPPSAPDWPAEWGQASSRILTIVVPVAGGAVVGLVLAAAAHLGVTLQLRRRSKTL